MQVWHGAPKASVKRTCYPNLIPLQEVGSSVAVIVGETNSSFLSVKGYYAPEHWDIYWTGRKVNYLSLP